MPRPGALVALLPALCACAHAAPRAAPRVTAARPALELLPAWRDQPVAVALPGGAVGLLLGSVRARWTPARDAIEVAPSAPSVALIEARPLAAGTLFRDERQRVWRADDFLGALDPLGEGPAAIVSPPGAAGSLALRRAGALVITDGRDAFAPAGLGPGAPFEVTFCDAARGYARAADGLLDVTRDGGRTWLPSWDERAACAVAPPSAPSVPAAVVARARDAAVRAVTSLLDAMPSATLADGQTVVATDRAVELWSADRARVSPLLRAAGCEVAAWGPCAAVFCAGDAPSLHRLCAGGTLARVEHGCRGAFVLSDDGRHALCATASLEVRLVDADAGAATRSEVPFGALAAVTLHGTLPVTGFGHTLRAAPRGADDDAPSLPLTAVARLGDRALVGHAGDRLYWRPLDQGPWRRVGGVPAQAFGGAGSRFLARGDLSPAPPRFECRADACRFGAAIVRRPDELTARDEPPAPDAPAGDRPALPAVDPAMLGGCASGAPLTRRRTLPGIPFDGTVHAALDLRGPTATVRWVSDAAVRAVALPEAALPGALSPGDDPEVAFPQGVPAAVAAVGDTLLVVTPDGRDGATLWALAAGVTPGPTALPGALAPSAGEALWEGTALADGGAFVMQSVVADEVATARAWVLSATHEVAASLQARARELPFVAVVGGAPGLVTWTPRAGGVDLAFRGATTARRWRVAAPATLPPCAAPDPAADRAELATDVRTERDGVRAGTAGRSVLRVTRVSVRLGADGLCVEQLRGVTGAPAPNGQGLFAADLTLTARGGGLVGHELDGGRAIPVRCPAPR